MKKKREKKERKLFCVNLMKCFSLCKCSVNSLLLPHWCLGLFFFVFCFWGRHQSTSAFFSRMHWLHFYSFVKLSADVCFFKFYTESIKGCLNVSVAALKTFSLFILCLTKVVCLGFYFERGLFPVYTLVYILLFMCKMSKCKLWYKCFLDLI